MVLRWSFSQKKIVSRANIEFKNTFKSIASMIPDEMVIRSSRNLMTIPVRLRRSLVQLEEFC